MIILYRIYRSTILSLLGRWWQKKIVKQYHFYQILSRDHNYKISTIR
jgi:hypothetical protein